MKNIKILLSSIIALIISMIATNINAQYYVVKDGRVVFRAETGRPDSIKFPKKIVKYTISFDTDGGSEVNSLTVLEGENFNAPANPTKEGYNFKGWYNGEAKYDFTKPVTSDLTLTAKWTEVLVVAIPEAIDLGLSVNWASFNLSASSQEGFDYYFAWGETDPKKVYDWDTYEWGYAYDKMTKYITNPAYGIVDNKSELEAEDDAATANLGSNWQMPTKADWEELINNCTWEWTTTEHSEKGYKVTSNKTGYTDKSIFLPADGYHSSWIGVGKGTEGKYWSRSLYANGASYLNFDAEKIKMSIVTRESGYSVRAVQPKIFKVTFDSNGGTDVDAQDVKTNANATTPANPTKDGYNFVGWYNGEDKYDFAEPVRSNLTLVAKWAEINASASFVERPFSVSATKNVYFSAGNLQYNTAEDKWQFAEHQYDLAISTNENWVDYFSWGTWNGDEGNPATKVGGKESDYPSTSFEDKDAAIGAGWQALSRDEWVYVVTERPNAKNLCGMAYITISEEEKTFGLVLLPDEWQQSQVPDVIFNSNVSETARSNGHNFERANEYTTEEWAKLEATGAIFLPAGGYRGSGSVKNLNTRGDYWASTIRVDPNNGNLTGYCMKFEYKGEEGLLAETHLSSDNRNDGACLRLVRKAQ